MTLPRGRIEIDAQALHVVGAPPPADDAGHAARLAAEVEWDEALSRRTPGELGLT